MPTGVGCGFPASSFFDTTREIEKFIIRQPPIGEKDDYDSENSWISDGLPTRRASSTDEQLEHKVLVCWAELSDSET